jgi:hypothetical protein
VSGHVFHPGHHELHGVTVVLDTTDGRTVVGRFHDVEDGRIRMLDAAVYEPGAVQSREEFLRRTAKFGVRVEHRQLSVVETDVVRITPLGQLAI